MMTGHVGHENGCLSFSPWEIGLCGLISQMRKPEAQRGQVA